MIRVILRHDVTDYETWRALFDDWFASGRPAAEGVRDHMFFQDTSNPNNVTVLFDFDDEDSAQRFIMNPEHRQVLERHGVQQNGLLMSVVDL